MSKPPVDRLKKAFHHEAEWWLMAILGVLLIIEYATSYAHWGYGVAIVLMVFYVWVSVSSAIRIHKARHSGAAYLIAVEDFVARTPKRKRHVVISTGDDGMAQMNTVWEEVSSA